MKISIGFKKTSKKWQNKDVSWEEFTEGLKDPVRTKEKVDEYLHKMTKAEKGNVKDVGGFVGGWLKDGKRKKENILLRSMLTLDADNLSPTDLEELLVNIDLYIASRYVIYSTHSHTPESPRIRVIVPLDEEVGPDKYEAVSRAVSKVLGIELFDCTTHQASRLMYFPSTCADGEYLFIKEDNGGELCVEEWLGEYGGHWQDCSLWPTSSKETLSISRGLKQQLPTDKKGIVGAFCRAYPVSECMNTFLSEVYTPCDIEGRYSFTGGSCSAGVIVYDDLFAYSHHATDPCGGRLLNAFDLVREHRFGDLDEDVSEGNKGNKRPSFTAMCKWVSSDDAVRRALNEEKAEDMFEKYGEEEEAILQTFTDVYGMLTVDALGKIEKTAANVLTILNNDPNLKDKLWYDCFSDRIEIRGTLPWRVKGCEDLWSDMDDSGLRTYVEEHYKIDAKNKIKDALNIVFMHHTYHPVQDYLNGLQWDGVARVEDVIVRYLGAEDNKYVRTVTRKSFIGAVARILDPGCKLDTTLTFTGCQGIGKTGFLREIGGGGRWFNDSLTGVEGKGAFEQLPGSWIVELGELSALKRSELEAVKHFLTKQHDKFRPAFKERVVEFKRSCAFFATTNEDEFLRDTEDRRFWPVKVGVIGEEHRRKLEDLKWEVDQLWAEAKSYYDSGEEWVIRDIEIEKSAKDEQKKYAIKSHIIGMIEEYLEMKITKNWYNLSIFERKQLLSDSGRDFTKDEEFCVQREHVSCVEIWCECLGGNKASLTRTTSFEISRALNSMERWFRDGRAVSAGAEYGRQKAYFRVH